jgi:hypothetical protein
MGALEKIAPVVIRRRRRRRIRRTTDGIEADRGVTAMAGENTRTLRRVAAAVATVAAGVASFATGITPAAAQTAASEPPITAKVVNGDLIVTDSPQGGPNAVRHPIGVYVSDDGAIVGLAAIGGNPVVLPPTLPFPEAPAELQRPVVAGPGCRPARAVLRTFGFGGGSTSYAFRVAFCPGATTAVRVLGLDGDDRIDVFSSIPVFVDGGLGNDTIAVVSPNTVVGGGPGADTVTVKGARAEVHGGPNDDVINSAHIFQDRKQATYEHTFYGDGGADQLRGAPVADIFASKAVRLNAFGGDDADVIEAAQATLVASGGNGIDRITGGPWGDTISGDEGDDVLEGRAGKDTIDGGAGFDTLYGNNGIDTLISKDDRADKVVNCGAGPNEREKVVRDPQDPVKNC